MSIPSIICTSFLCKSSENVFPILTVPVLIHSLLRLSENSPQRDNLVVNQPQPIGVRWSQMLHILLYSVALQIVQNNPTSGFILVGVSFPPNIKL